MLRKVVNLGYFCTKTQLYKTTVTPNKDNIIQRFETVVVYFMKIFSGFVTNESDNKLILFERRFESNYVSNKINLLSLSFVTK